MSKWKLKRPVLLHQCLMLWLLQQISAWAFRLWEPNREIPRMKSWAWNRDGLFKKDGSQMCTGWRLSKRPQHNCLHMIVLCIDPTGLFTWEFLFILNQRQNLALGFMISRTKCTSSLVYMWYQPVVQETALLNNTILQCRYGVLTYGWAGSPADWTLYPPNSGEGQGHSARSASSGTQGLWVSHAEQKVIKHLECQNKTLTRAAVFMWFLNSCTHFCLHMHVFPPALFVSGLMWQV